MKLKILADETLTCSGYQDDLWNDIQNGNHQLQVLEGYTYRNKQIAAGKISSEFMKEEIEKESLSLDYDEHPALAIAGLVSHRAWKKVRDQYEGKKVGVYVGSSLINSTYLARQYEDYHNGIMPGATVLWKGMNNYVSSSLATLLGTDGPTSMNSTSCLSGALALSSAMADLESGKVEAAIVVGVDSCLNKSLLDCWVRLRILNTNLSELPPSRPYCKTRSGMVLGEGAACVVITKGEESDLSITRTVHNQDQEGKLEQSADSVVSCLEEYKTEMGVDYVDFVIGSGCGSKSLDFKEAEAVGRAFGKETPLYSLKSITGNTLAANGLIALITALRMIKESYVPANHFIQEVDEQVGDFARCYGSSGKQEVKQILVNMLGFGGVNACFSVGKNR